MSFEGTKGIDQGVIVQGIELATGLQALDDGSGVLVSLGLTAKVTGEELERTVSNARNEKLIWVVNSPCPQRECRR